MSILWQLLFNCYNTNISLILKKTKMKVFVMSKKQVWMSEWLKI